MASPYAGFWGLCLNKPAKWDRVSTVGLNYKIAQAVNDFNAGKEVEAIIPINGGYIPEYSIYDAVKKQRMSRGVQDIVHYLVKKHYITAKVAQKMFNYDPNADWHYMTLDQRINTQLGKRFRCRHMLHPDFPGLKL